MTVRPLDPAVIGEQCEHTEWVPGNRVVGEVHGEHVDAPPTPPRALPRALQLQRRLRGPLPDFLHAESEPVRYSGTKTAPKENQT